MNITFSGFVFIFLFLSCYLYITGFLIYERNKNKNKNKSDDIFWYIVFTPFVIIASPVIVLVLYDDSGADILKVYNELAIKYACLSSPILALLTLWWL